MLTNKKLTYKFVQGSFESCGYTLVSKIYKNARTKLDYICSKGHSHSIKWNDWQGGHRCPFCAGKAKPTLEQIEESFTKEGYVLLSKEYVNTHIKLDYLCSKGHKHNIKWSDWRQGVKCPYCTNKMKLTLEQIKKSFKKEEYILLSEEYINNKTKLNYKCSTGHEHSINWNDWRRGRRCPICDDILKSGSGHPSWKGGTSYEPYCPIWSDKEYKQDIKLRDGNKCLNPTCSKKDLRIHIHHIDYDKKNCNPNNVITLCGSCNSKANIDREWHTAWYQALMHRKYNYKY